MAGGADDPASHSSTTGSPPARRLTPDGDSDDSDDFNLYPGDGDAYELTPATGSSTSSRSPADSSTPMTATPPGGTDPADDDRRSARGADNARAGGRENARRRPGSFSTVQSFQLYTPDEERAVVRKFDRKLVMFVAFLYMLSFLDRSNIGNARIAGLEDDLKLTADQYEWLLGAFYISYIGFEWMSVMWKIFPAHIYLSIVVASWGITASLQAVATSFGGLLFLRIMLGIGEAAFAGIPFYLSFFFNRDELALRTGYFISAAPLATTFASSLAWVIIKLGERSPIASWRLLFLLEGFPSVFIAIVVWHIIPDGPARAKFLTKREKKVARLRLRRDKTTNQGGGSGLKWREMLQAVVDPKSYMTAFMFFFTNMAFASLPVFLPTIIHRMGHSAIVSQALAAPPFLVSFVAVLVTARLSDKQRNRGYFVCFHALLSATGYALLAIAGHWQWNNWIRYAAVFLAAAGFFSVVTIILAWTINNQDSESKQGAGFAVLQVIGQCGPILGTRLYPEDDAPYYVKGMAVCAVAMVLVAGLSVCLRFYLKRLNSQHDVVEYERLDGEEEEDWEVKNESQGGQRFEFML